MHIVVVDPSRTVLKIVARLLEVGSHEIHPFTDGNAALEHIKSDSGVDALITSVELSAMSGLELCKQVRALASNARQPIYIVLMSANYEERKLIEALDNGADDFIGKPPATEELYARLRAAERLRTMQRELVRLAMTDSLSGLLNRRAFFEKAHEARADVTALSAIMLDIDHFKRINDEFGHDAGDEVIRRVAKEARAVGEIVGRLGGEEFAIVLPGRTLAEAVDVAERLRLTVADLRVENGGKTIRFTCSLGVSDLNGAESFDEILKRADIALYSAKRTSRNCVVAYDASLAADDYEKANRIVRVAAR